METGMQKVSSLSFNSFHQELDLIGNVSELSCFTQMLLLFIAP